MTLPAETIKRLQQEAITYGNSFPFMNGISVSNYDGRIAEATHSLPLIELLQNIQATELKVNGTSYLYKRIEETLNTYQNK